MNSAAREGHFDQTKQWLSFTEGVAVSAPDPTNYPIHVLTGDTFLYEIQGGFPDGPGEPFVTDPIIYPSSDYWQTLLDGDKKRPYVDISISEYNTLRVPSAVHEYDLYCDKGRFYEDVVIDGSLKVGGLDFSADAVTVPGNLSCDKITANEISNAVARVRIPILQISSDYSLKNEDTGSVIHSSPTVGNVDITLPNDLSVGFVVTITNLLPGKTTTLPLTLKARGHVLSEPYSAATIYFDGTDWYGYGDLV